MFSECLSAIVKFGLKAYEYFQPPTPEPPVVDDWTSNCAHWVGVLAGPIILVLFFKRTYDIIKIRRAINAAEKPEPAEGEAEGEGAGLVPAEEAMMRRQEVGDADVAAEQQEEKAEERPDHGEGLKETLRVDAPVEEDGSGDA